MLTPHPHIVSARRRDDGVLNLAQRRLACLGTHHVAVGRVPEVHVRVDVAVGCLEPDRDPIPRLSIEPPVIDVVRSLECAQRKRRAEAGHGRRLGHRQGSRAHEQVVVRILDRTHVRVCDGEDSREWRHWGVGAVPECGLGEKPVLAWLQGVWARGEADRLRIRSIAGRQGVHGVVRTAELTVGSRVSEFVIKRRRSGIHIQNPGRCDAESVDGDGPGGVLVGQACSRHLRRRQISRSPNADVVQPPRFVIQALQSSPLKGDRDRRSCRAKWDFDRAVDRLVPSAETVLALGVRRERIRIAVQIELGKRVQEDLDAVHRDANPVARSGVAAIPRVDDVQIEQQHVRPARSQTTERERLARVAKPPAELREHARIAVVRDARRPLGPRTRLEVRRVTRLGAGIEVRAHDIHHANNHQ